MGEIDYEKLYNDTLNLLNGLTSDIKQMGQDISDLSKVVYKLTGAVEANDHGEAIKALDKRHREDTADIYNLMRSHEKDCHSSKSGEETQKLLKENMTQIAEEAANKIISDHNNEAHSVKTLRDNWVAVAAILCMIATFMSPFIQKWLN